MRVALLQQAMQALRWAWLASFGLFGTGNGALYNCKNFGHFISECEQSVSLQLSPFFFLFLSQGMSTYESNVVWVILL